MCTQHLTEMRSIWGGGSRSGLTLSEPLWHLQDRWGMCTESRDSTWGEEVRTEETGEDTAAEAVTVTDGLSLRLLLRTERFITLHERRQKSFVCEKSSQCEKLISPSLPPNRSPSHLSCKSIDAVRLNTNSVQLCQQKVMKNETHFSSKTRKWWHLWRNIKWLVISLKRDWNISVLLWNVFVTVLQEWMISERVCVCCSVGSVWFNFTLRQKKWVLIGLWGFWHHFLVWSER